mmetsp:Transcript_27786/g.82951  ORF Transcript_27786/g.82951 Transcript_27786/m.82951 type:complete len:508 (+) Transcript_27786:90-1613(+)
MTSWKFYPPDNEQSEAPDADFAGPVAAAQTPPQESSPLYTTPVQKSSLLPCTEDAPSGFVVFVLPYQDEQLVAVRCLVEKCELAKRSNDIMKTVLQCHSRDLWQERLAHTDFQELSQEIPWDHFSLAEILDGPCSGVRALGIGTNKTKLQRACRLAVSVTAVLKGVGTLPEGSSAFASFLTLTEDARNQTASLPEDILSHMAARTCRGSDELPRVLPPAVSVSHPRLAESPPPPTAAPPPARTSSHDGCVRGRSRTKREPGLVTQDEREDWAACVDAMEELRSALTGFPDAFKVLECVDRVQRKAPRCEHCRADWEKAVWAPIQALEDVWRNVSLWSGASERVLDMLRGQLEAPLAHTILPIHRIRYTQRWASDTFRHGSHALRSVVDVAEDLVSGRIQVLEDSMVLDVVWFHGEHWSCNNRHLKALKLYLREVQPEWRRAEEMARVRVWPLNHKLRLSGGWAVTEKLSHAMDTRSHGRSLSLRPSRSPSRQGVPSRRVHFVSSQGV